jgi:geranylgeranyl diphosphate synthase type II
MTAAAESLDFAAYTSTLRGQIDSALERFADYGPGCPPYLAEAIRHSLLAPGKRLRPMLMLMACQACGYDTSRAIAAACSVEMIHTYSLIHDDLPAMDDDDMRRGRPSCHAKFGEATAILAGDALLAQAFEVLATGTEPPDVAARCVTELAKAAGACQLVGGQEDDLKAEFTDLGLEQLEAIHRRKTGAMIRVSLRLGGIVGQATDKQLAALDAYGEQLGLAFQIVDDLLDQEGTAAALGKRTRKDHDHGKLTFPALLGAEESRCRAEQLVAGAIDAVGIFGPKSEPLVALAKYVLERDH